MTKESAVKRRSNGQFAKGNKEGKKFEPKNNANPNGRRGALSDIINVIFDEIEPDGKSKKEKMLRKVYRMAMNGSLGAVNYLSDRTEGKAKEIREVTNKNEPIKIITID